MGPLLTVLLIILLILIAIAGVAIGATVLGAKKVRKSVENKQELILGQKSAAPLNWNGSPKREAVQHRRLVKAMQLARSVHGDAEATNLGQQAVRIEQELVRAALLPKGPKKAALDNTEELVSAVEELAAGAYERNSSALTIQTDLSELRERLQALNEAYRELG